MMKRIFFIIFLLFAICHPAFAFREIPYAKTPIEGFRGIKWGDSIAQHKNELTKTENILNDPDFDYLYNGHERPFESPTIGGAKTSRFTYCFDQYGFYKAFMLLYYFPKRAMDDMPKSYTDIASRFTKIYDACVKQWGTPKKEVHSQNNYKTVVYSWFSFLDKTEDVGVAELNVQYNKDNKLYFIGLYIYSDAGQERENMRRKHMREKYNDF